MIKLLKPKMIIKSRLKQILNEKIKKQKNYKKQATFKPIYRTKSFNAEFGINRRNFLRMLGGNIGSAATNQVESQATKLNPIKKLTDMKKNVERASDYIKTARPMKRRTFLKSAGKETMRQAIDKPKQTFQVGKVGLETMGKISKSPVNIWADWQ